MMSEDTPKDYAEPEWSAAGRVHDWRNYINDEIKLMWESFSLTQRAALSRQAEEIASCEEWD